MEFADLGKHCTYCKQKDFLPIKCEFCKNWYCKEHYIQDNHSCKEPRPTRIKKHTKYKNKGPRCIKCRKRQDIHFYMTCKYCNKPTCVSHRFPDDHDCWKDMSKKITKVDTNNKKGKKKMSIGERLLQKLRLNKKKKDSSGN